MRNITMRSNSTIYGVATVVSGVVEVIGSYIGINGLGACALSLLGIISAVQKD